MSHNERCKECKIRFRELLEKIYGPVKCEHRFPISTKPEDFREHPRYPVLNEIYTSLKKNRGFTEFVRASYVKVDFFLPEQGMIVEFDESQHFTEPRKIALSHYPSDLEIGFSQEAWIKHCDEIHAHDNLPPFRDEQRAWYDTLKDFIPEIKGYLPTVRLYSRDVEWCTLDPEKSEDVEFFRQIIKNKQGAVEKQRTNFWQIQTEEDRYTLDAFIWFEYLLNKLKVQYLLDCCEGDFNDDSQYLRNPGNKQKIINSESGGRAIKAYFNKKLRGGTIPGPLFKNRDPNNYELIKNIDEANNLLQTIITSSENWFELFCEYVLIKIAVHEIYVDTAYEENKNKYGFPTFKKLNLDIILKKASEDKNKEVRTVQGKFLRNFVLDALLLGIDLSVVKPGISQDFYKFELGSGTYEFFLSKRSDWINTADYEIRKIKQKMSKENLIKVMDWNRNALCAFDAGPIFLRRRKEFLMPFFCQAISEYMQWPSNLSIRNKLDEIVKKDVNILIGSYWEEKYIVNEKLENQTPAFFKDNKKLAAIIRQRENELDAQFKVLCVSTVTDLQQYFSRKKSVLKNITKPSITQSHNQNVQSIPSTKTHGKFSEVKSLDPTSAENLYNLVREELDPLFGKLVIDHQKSKFTYRGKNEIGYPKKTELDMISLFRFTKHNERGVKFWIYPYVLAGHTGLTDANRIYDALPVGSVEKRERNNPHKGAIFIEGVFSNEEEIEKFVKWIVFGNDRIIPV